MSAAQPTPFQHLWACLVAIRGGRATELQLSVDLLVWMDRHGPITKENVEKWASESYELKFALEVLARRE